MAGIVVQVACTVFTLQADTLLHQVFVDVEQAATREYSVEFIFQQLIHAGATTDDHSLDVEVVQCVRDTMKQHAVLSRDRMSLVSITGGGLRIAAAHITRRQYGFRAALIQHRQGRQPNLAEQAL